MCLYTHIGLCKVATEPIECYKTFVYRAETGILRAWFMGTNYGPVDDISNHTLKADSFREVIPREQYSWFYCLYEVYEGIHTYSNYSSAYRIGKIDGIYSAYARTYKCVIPKGAKYYEGIHGDLCSDMLIVKELVK